MSNTPESSEDQADLAVNEYLHRVDSGEDVDQNAFIANHSDVAEALRSFFAGERLMQLLVGSACADPAASDSAMVSATDTGPGDHNKKADRQTRQHWTTFPVTFGRYRVERMLGEGAMGTVFQAHDTQLDCAVALKLPHTPLEASLEIRRRLHLEAQAAARLRHPNICRVFDVGEIDGVAFIAMELIDGVSLSLYARPGKLPTLGDAANIVRKLAIALQEAHDQGIVHRDLKPANVLLRRIDNEPMLMDFGLAQKPVVDGGARLTTPGMIVGSPAYMAPEQASGDHATIGTATDVYGLGVVFYELLTGRLPFDGSPSSVLLKVLSEEPTPVNRLRPAIDETLTAIVQKMLAKQPAQRFSSMLEVADAISDWIATHQQPRWKLGPKTFTDARAAATLAVGVVIVLAILGISLSNQHAQRQEFARQEKERLVQTQEREKQETERQLAERARQQDRKVVEIEQEFADRFLRQLITSKDITPDDARQRALKELPALVKLPLEEIQALIDKQLPEAAHSPLERARTALAQGNLDAVLSAADEERNEGRELAMLEGSAALAKFRESPQPVWNERALAAYRRAIALTDREQEPTKWADAAISTAFVLNQLSRFKDAEPLLVESVQVREVHFGPESTEVAFALNHLAWLFQEMDRHSEAEPLIRRALRINERANGSTHPSVAISLRNLAASLRKTSHQFEAEQLLRRALEINEQGLGPKHPEVSEVLGSLAKLCCETNRFAESEQLHRRALTIAEEAFGPKHPTVASRLKNLAVLLLELNRLSEAEPLLRRALVIDEQAYGGNATSVSNAMSTLALVLSRQNKIAEAEPLARRALVMDEEAYGPGHSVVAIRLTNLAALLQDTNRMSQAELLERRAVRIAERAVGSDQSDFASHLHNLAALLRTTNRHVEAASLARRAIAIKEQSLSPDHPDVSISLNDLALSLKATNRPLEAEPLFRRALVIAEQTLGTEHVGVAIKLLNLASLLTTTNRGLEAEPLLRRSVQIGERAFGSEHPRFAICLRNLAEALRNTNHPQTAEPLFRQALAIYERTFGSEHPEVATTLNDLGLLLQYTNRQVASEPLFRRALEILHEFRQATGHEHQAFKFVLANYQSLLESEKISTAEIESRLATTSNFKKPFLPIFPDVERLLGPASPIQEALAKLDEENKTQGKPAIYYLPKSEPITPHLNKLLLPSSAFLNFRGIVAFKAGSFAESVVLYDAALLRSGYEAAPVSDLLQFRANRAATLRDLGEFEIAKTTLEELLPQIDTQAEVGPGTKGRVRYHLAKCEYRLGNRDSAQRIAEESLKVYGDDPALDPIKRETAQLLADIKANKPPPALPMMDAKVEIEKARQRFAARNALIDLSNKEPASKLIDEMLGPTMTIQEVLNALDEQYRKDNKPRIWFLPLSEPIAPHLDELLGPIPSKL